MAYVSGNFYLNEFYGDAVPDGQFQKYESRAEDVVDALTRNRIKEAGLDSFPASVVLLIQKAVCAQIEWYVWNGLETAVLGTDSGGFTVGKVSVSGKGNNAQSAKMGGYVAPACLAYLEQTGLLLNAVPVLERWFY